MFPDSGGDEEQFKGPEGRSIIGRLWKLNCWKGQTGQGAARVHRWLPEAVSPSRSTIGHCHGEGCGVGFPNLIGGRGPKKIQSQIFGRVRH